MKLPVFDPLVLAVGTSDLFGATLPEIMCPGTVNTAMSDGRRRMR
jgi:hypothetical protein